MKYFYLSLIMLSFNFTQAQDKTGQVHRIDKAIDALVPLNAKIEKLGGGFMFTEGPIWDKRGFLLFSDIPANKIIKWQEGKGFSVFKNPSEESNGLFYDAQGRLIICEHKTRRITRIEKDSNVTILTNKFNGKKFNSPNDLVLSRNGAVYFTDPPWGLPKQNNDPAKELKENGVYRFYNGKTDLLTSSQNFPNGITISPDEKYLYYSELTQGTEENKNQWFKCKIKSDGLIEKPVMIFEKYAKGEEGGTDGMKTDIKGNLYCTGPGGVLVLSPEGKHLGTIEFPEVPANCAWGDKDGKTLYVTARNGIYRIKLNVPGYIPYIK